jgi:predicted nucleic acid-binding protein
MILVDTSVWIDHLRRGNDLFSDLLNENRVATHPLILGELSLGNISKRATILDLVRNLPVAREASHDEVLLFIEENRMWSKGIGYFDMHLLCASLIESIPLWTLDTRLAEAAKAFGPKNSHL